MDLKMGPCKRSDLEAIIARDAYWSVDNKGNARKHVANRSEPTITAYHCYNCGVYFQPEDQYSLDKAWQAALDHLKTSPYNQK